MGGNSLGPSFTLMRMHAVLQADSGIFVSVPSWPNSGPLMSEGALPLTSMGAIRPMQGAFENASKNVYLNHYALYVLLVETWY